MKLLFEIDTKDYNINGKAFIRPSARSIIIRGNKIAMVHSIKYDYYKFPGGGIKADESYKEALIRETREETGLIVIPSSICEYGYVHRIQRVVTEDVFIQDNYYYLCEAEQTVIPQKLDDYERQENFTLEFIEPSAGIYANRNNRHGPKDSNMIERESRVLEMLISDGLFTF